MCNLKEKLVNAVVEHAKFKEVVFKIVADYLQSLMTPVHEVVEETQEVKQEPKKKRHYNKHKKSEAK